MNQKQPLIVLVGPTAVGKTATSISLAKKYNGEVISGDSMQVYKQMDIGTAKITKEEMNGIPHHLVDIKEPDESFSVADFQDLAKKAVSMIHQKNKIPFIVGGTGLYVNSVIYNYDFSEVSEDKAYRNSLDKYADDFGNVALHEKLKIIDPESYEELHPNNRRRVIRALEVYRVTGNSIKEQHSNKLNSPYDCIVIGLTLERDLLYNRINERVDHMINQGLISEVETLYHQGYQQCQSMQAIGYKEIIPYINGLCSKEEAVNQLKQNSRRFAKRQLTWFRNKMSINWFDMTKNRENTEKEIYAFLEGKLL